MKNSRLNIGLLSLCQCLMLSSTLTVLTYSSLVGRMLTGSTAMATIPAAIAIIGAAITAFPASFFMKKFGRKRGFQLGAVSALISGIIAVYAISTSNFPLFCVALFFHGIYQAFAAFYRFAAMEVSLPSNHKQAVSLVLFGGLFAALISPSIARSFEANFILPIEFAGTYVFVIALSLLAQLVIFTIKFPEVDLSGKEDNVQSKSTTILDVLKRPVFLCACLNAAGAYFMMSYIMTASPVEMVEYCGFAISDAAGVIQWHAVAMFGPAFFTGSLIARFGSVRILISGMISFALAATVAIQGIEAVNFYTALILIGIGWNLMFTAGTTLLEKAYSHSEKALVQGMNDFIVYSFTAAASLTSGLMLQSVGWENMNRLVFSVLLVLFTITTSYMIYEKRKTIKNA